MREMKDSGIEWVGIIPKSWNISRLKYIAKFFNGDRGKIIRVVRTLLTMELRF